MTTIFRTIFGSRLYGTANENSDYDVKSVYLPDLEGCLVKMQNFTSRHREFVKDEIKYDCEDIPLQSFLKMASEGQTMAYDMLFSPKDKWLPDAGEDFGFWENVILPARDRFISRKCVNFLGYAIGQALKYGNKGKKLKQYEEAVKRLSVISDKSAPAQNYANMLIDGDLIKIEMRGVCPDIRASGTPYIIVGDTSFPLAAPVNSLLECYKKRIEMYGKRTRSAAENDGRDWKALSHALRALYEAEELVDTGKITFPLPLADEVKALKEGRLDVLSPDETILEEARRVKQKILESDLPETGGEYEDLVLSAYSYYYGLDLKNDISEPVPDGEPDR